MNESRIAMTDLLRSSAVTAFHDQCLAVENWTNRPPQHADGAWHWVEQNHRYNCLLWAEEDLARRRDVPDAAIAENKRHIDGFNQQRNDAVERIDDTLLTQLAANMNAAAPLHSETAGMMIDRLSILSLKIHAMRIQTTRTDVASDHISASRQKLERLIEQRNDLAVSVDRLLDGCVAGTARYKIYRQFKMYNDPNLNPQLYAAKTSQGE
jgi:Protein of unknown function (DUF4254)